jgi:N6-L-threonylcarbamoyladenine synthase
VRKALALRQRSGQKDRWRAGLSDHALGVTCEGEADQRKNAAHMTGSLTFLGIESSCDDTAAAVIRHVPGTAPEILSSVVEGQTALHAAFGGVVPEIAARAHVERLDYCVELALREAGVGLRDLDGIAVTAGPGLIGGVLSGVMLAKGLCAATGLPLVGVNHLAGHALTPRLTDQLAFPYLMLLVSGGHCQFLIVRGPDEFQRLGGTIDDAPGEAFDKTAKLLGLPQPGGPAVQAEATLGNAKRFAFPRPLLDRPGCDMSFSGLKTALLRARDAVIAEKSGLTVQDRRDMCASFQLAVADVMAEKTRRALAIYLQDNPVAPALAVAGGVAANTLIRAMLETVSAQNGCRFTAPPLRLCTDNAAMIAWAGIERFRNGGRDDLTLTARPRWPLDATAAPMIGSGKKGAKA